MNTPEDIKGRACDDCAWCYNYNIVSGEEPKYEYYFCTFVIPATKVGRAQPACKAFVEGKVEEVSSDNNRK